MHVAWVLPAMPLSSSATLNAIVDSLPVEEKERVLAACEPVDVKMREEVYSPTKPIEHLYFPMHSVFSHIAVVDDDVAIEVGTIGREGIVGLPAFLGTTRSPNTVFCQVPGSALRLTTESLFEVLQSRCCRATGVCTTACSSTPRRSSSNSPKTPPATASTPPRSERRAGC